MDELSNAEMYNPTPNTEWLTMLRMRFAVGVGVFAEATPRPMAGCISINGMSTVPKPVSSAGAGVGASNHAGLVNAIGKAANAMPVA